MDIWSKELRSDRNGFMTVMIVMYILDEDDD